MVVTDFCSFELGCFYCFVAAVTLILTLENSFQRKVRPAEVHVLGKVSAFVAADTEMAKDSSR